MSLASDGARTKRVTSRRSNRSRAGSRSAGKRQWRVSRRDLARGSLRGRMESEDAVGAEVRRRDERKT